MAANKNQTPLINAVISSAAAQRAAVENRDLGRERMV